MCATVMYNNAYLVLDSIPARVPKTLGISCNENTKGVFCYVNEVVFGGHLREGAGCWWSQPVIRVLELPVLPPNS